jgi:hypothetical protein
MTAWERIRFEPVFSSGSAKATPRKPGALLRSRRSGGHTLAPILIWRSRTASGSSSTCGTSLPRMRLGRSRANSSSRPKSRRQRRARESTREWILRPCKSVSSSAWTFYISRAHFECDIYNPPGAKWLSCGHVDIAHWLGSATESFISRRRASRIAAVTSLDIGAWLPVWLTRHFTWPPSASQTSEMPQKRLPLSVTYATRNSECRGCDAGSCESRVRMRRRQLRYVELDGHPVQSPSHREYRRIDPEKRVVSICTLPWPSVHCAPSACDDWTRRE